MQALLLGSVIPKTSAVNTPGEGSRRLYGWDNLAAQVPPLGCRRRGEDRGRYDDVCTTKGQDLHLKYYSGSWKKKHPSE
jgi:hypothetical protein